ncbi:MAG: V-type ATP synthase subunit D [Lentisphaerae bacterium]|nr:V-type ATP synthase subunit D [Lentisphaerota bacterium]
MARRPAPTKANLFQAQAGLRFATEGCDLLHQKRDVLVMELMSTSAAFGDTEKALREALTAAFDDFVPAYLACGRETLDRVFSAAGPDVSFGVRERGLMGTRVPEIKWESGGASVFPGLLDASPDLDAAVADLRRVMKALVRYIETVAAIWRLATEIEKTQRRINAIENVFIPEARETVAWIGSVMEENEREELFRRKRLKSRAAS